MDTYSVLARLLEAQRQSYSVYALVNHTKKAIYFGVTNNFPARYVKHVLLNRVEATKYWSENDEIEHAIIEEKMTQKEASKLAHAMEKEDYPDFPGYRVIRTSGI